MLYIFKRFFFFFIVFLQFLFVVSSVFAAIDLSSGYWETTFDCDTDGNPANGDTEWTAYGQTLNCDGVGKGGGWYTSDGKYEQIVAVANNLNGRGGKGQRHWICDGTNCNSGGLRLSFNTPPGKIWMRWYMRWESGFGTFDQYKVIYAFTSGTNGPVLNTHYPSDDGMRFVYFANSQEVRCTNCGFGGSFYKSKVSDGSWHLFEVMLDPAGGTLKMWVDENLVMNDFNVTYKQNVIDYILVGSNQKNVANGRTMYIDYDDIAISTTGYIGPVGGSGGTQTPPPPPAGDITPPSTITDLSVGNCKTTSCGLSWSAPGDDGSIGSATSYDVRYSTSPITSSNWASASQVSGEPTPSASGSSQSFIVTGLNKDTTYYFAIKAIDDKGNVNSLSNVVNENTFLFYTTYDCDTDGNPSNGDTEWTAPSQTLNCDGVSRNGDWAASNGKYEQIVTIANNPDGAGGKGQRHWTCDGTNDNSGDIRINFATPQNKLWIRTYQRFENGWQSGFGQLKDIYAYTNVPAQLVFNFYGGSTISLVTGSEKWYNGIGGWTSMYPTGVADGTWHHVEVLWDIPNKIFRLWIDGNLIVEELNANYGTITSINSLLLPVNAKNIANGGCMYHDFDDIAISTKGYIGPVQGSGSSPPVFQCSDGLDNDGDGLTDYPSDPGCSSSSDNDEFNVPVDTTPPVLSSGVPSGVLASGTTQTTLTLTSDEDANCRYSVTSGQVYSSMSIFSSTGGTSHSTTISGLSDGQSYNYYIKCQDSSGNTNINDYLISFSVNSLSPSSNQIIFLFEGFEDSAFSSRGWYDSTNLKLSTVEKNSGNSAVEYHFLPGMTTPEISGSAIRHLFTDTEEVYVRYYVKYSSNWVGSGVSYHPHEFFILTNVDGAWSNLAGTHLTSYIEQNSLKPALIIQDTLNIDSNNINVDLTGISENRAVAGCNGNSNAHGVEDCYFSTFWRNNKWWLYPNPVLTVGVWHKVEAYFKLNSIVGGIGQKDGVISYWLDDNLLINHNDVVLRTGQHPNMKYNQFIIAPYIGPGSPIDQTMWVDDLVIANKRNNSSPSPAGFCGDGTCNSGETCSSCPSDCSVSASQICCVGSILTGNCCGDSDCSGGKVCSSNTCTSVPVGSGNSINAYSVGDGYLEYGYDSNWGVVRSAASANYFDASSVEIESGSYFSSADAFKIMRGVLNFDTSAIPDNAVVTSAVLKLYVTGVTNTDNDGVDYLVVTMGATPSNVNSLSASNYGNIGSLSSPLVGSNLLDLGSVSLNAYNNLVFNSVGLSNINKQGYTSIAVREGHDITNSAIDVGTSSGYGGNRVSFRSSNVAGTIQDPVLVVTYSIPSVCGNNILETGETCEGTNFGGKTCSDYGFNSGVLSCSSSCSIVSSGCFNLVVDTTPPARSNPLPSGNLSSGSVKTTLSLSTDEQAVCKYSNLPGITYNSMTNLFSNTNAKAHTTEVTGLQDGKSYTYYVRCRDAKTNVNSNDFLISFSVSNSGSSSSNNNTTVTPPPAPVKKKPDSGGGGGSSGGGSGSGKKTNNKFAKIYQTEEQVPVCIPSYEYDLWSACVDSIQYRVYRDLNGCNNETSFKEESRVCVETNTDIENSFLNAKELEVVQIDDTRYQASFNGVPDLVYFNSNSSVENDAVLIENSNDSLVYLALLVDDSEDVKVYSLKLVDDKVMESGILDDYDLIDYNVPEQISMSTTKATSYYPVRFLLVFFALAILVVGFFGIIFLVKKFHKNSSYVQVLKTDLDMENIKTFLKDNKDKFSLEDLKKSLLDAGYDEAKIDEAIKNL